MHLLQPSILLARGAATALLICGATSLSSCARRQAEPGALTLSGNIEVVDAQLSFKSAGRVIERAVVEGDRVATGQLLARLDDTEQTQQLAARRAELAATEALVAELEAGSRPQEIAAAEAALRSAEAERERAELDLQRQRELLRQAAISTREFDTAQALARVASARANEANERLKLVREGPRPETVRQARARADQARAAVALAETLVANTRLLSPMNGIVLARHIEPGEFVAAGTPVVTVADTARVWLRAYVNQTDLTRVRHGQRVAVRIDGAPERTYEGVVGFISSEAEFTPKTVQTAKERVKLVFRIRIDVDNPNDELKSGMPADALIPATP